MDFVKAIFKLNGAEEYQKDLLIAALGDAGYDTFNDIEEGFEAFIAEDQFSETALAACKDEFKEELQFTVTTEKIKSENWNEEWEKNFSPLIVADACYVRATFHEPQPAYAFEIVIDPKMAFGTGHHETTTMMLEYVLETPVEGKKILDMGCGTGILAILASKRGAAEVTAIDYDVLSYESTIENAELNGITNLIPIHGGKEVIPETKYDVIFANINRNILLDQIPVYATVLQQGGQIFFSGFYESPDLDMIKESCAQFNIQYVGHKKKGEWVAASFEAGR